MYYYSAISAWQSVSRITSKLCISVHKFFWTSRLWENEQSVRLQDWSGPGCGYWNCSPQCQFCLMDANSTTVFSRLFAGGVVSPLQLCGVICCFRMPPSFSSQDMLRRCLQTFSATYYTEKSCWVTILQAPVNQNMKPAFSAAAAICVHKYSHLNWFTTNVIA